jgi:inhibitor of KinA
VDRPGCSKSRILNTKPDALANPSSSYSIFPLGDSAITLDLGNCIDEQRNITVLALYEWLRAQPVPGILDIIMAYSSVSLFYDLTLLGAGQGYRRMEELLQQAWKEAGTAVMQPSPGAGSRLWELPVCYEGEYAPDIGSVAGQRGLSTADVVALHTGVIYRVYMIGFLPGFPYLGSVDERLQVSRKDQPVTVKAGGVGIAGMQTGIYTLNSPGGWPIIGRTPVRFFEPHSDPPVRIRTGDRVRFYPVTPAGFKDFSSVPDSKPFH